MQLPTGMEIMQHFHFIQSTLSTNTKKSSILYCVSNNLKYSKCEEGKCICILSMIKAPWIKAGFPILSDKNIKKDLTNLEKEYYNLKKHEKRGSPADLEKQKIFKAKLVQVFWIGIPDLRDTILKDKKRSDKDKAEDLKFLDDQERHRKFIIGTEDKKYGRKTKENI